MEFPAVNGEAASAPVSELAGHPGRTGMNVTGHQRTVLERWARGRTTPQRLVVRARIVLLAAEGVRDGQIADRLRVSRQTVRLWRRRFAAGGPDALARDAPGRGRPREIPSSTTIAVLEATRDLAACDRSVRRVATQCGTSPSTVWRIWKRYELEVYASREDIDALLVKLISETATLSD